MTRNNIEDCRQSRSWVIYKAYRVIATSKLDDLNKKYISNRIKYPQHDLKQDEAIRQINLGVDDNVLSLEDKGEQKIYYFSKKSFENSDHDWYCYKCHEQGSVFKCSTCWRVYHISCANFTDEQCAVCEHMKQSQHLIRNEMPSIARINEVLRHLLNKMMDESKQLVPLSTIEGSNYNSVPISEMKKLVYNYRINFNVMEKKINKLEYKTFVEFAYDTEDLCHNLLVINGLKGRIAKLVDRMFDSVLKDIDLANSCLTCFRNLCENKLDYKSNLMQICSPAHEVAFIKFQSFPLWPCRIISVNGQRYQAWFFGATANECIRCFAKKKSIYSIEEAVKILSTKVQPLVSSKPYQKAIADYDAYMERQGEMMNRVGGLLIQTNGDSTSHTVENDEDAENSPLNFQLAFSDIYHGGPSITNVSTNQITNGNTKSSDGISNLSFTFNGDSMNNSISNPTDLDFTSTTPLKTESRQEKIQISTPKNFNNLSSTISNGNSSFRFGKKINKINVNDNDIKEENKILKRRLKETEDKVMELKQALKEAYTKEYVENLNQQHKNMLGDIKKKSWCRVCENEAFFYCCTNTFYCTVACQLKDWWSEHKKICFRKKQKKET